MRGNLVLLFFFLCCQSFWAQKDSLSIGDRYADDQLYFSISYAQLSNQPSILTRSRFSYAISAGFMKDIILTKQGDFSFAFGLGYGLEHFNHNLKVETSNLNTVFGTFNDGENGVFSTQYIEFPLEFRWRTSTAKKYKFWRIYSGIKFLYNISNQFTTETNLESTTYKNVTAFNTFQYGLTLSVGYDLINFNVFYGLSPIFEEGFLNNESIETSIIKFGLTVYIL